ncbi:hypothetical protein GE061_005721 [Apolygus lucorum]|uniref:lysozyme n=1 Tax=Apolygus lucorum TaxID=248454 RepID=A0A6A4J497_APOLU|nr:hypothetical protein GE061_005721 [Apolygus lucorum]
MRRSLNVVHLALWAVALSATTLGRVMDHCDVASTLLRLGVPRNQVSTWVCIAKWESSYNTGAVGPPNTDGSRDHGLFQINDRYWCSPPGTGCGVSCKSLETDDIGPQWRCAKRVYKATQHQSGNGFTAWTTYRPHCAGDTSSYVAGCRLSTSDVDVQSHHPLALALPAPAYGQLTAFGPPVPFQYPCASLVVSAVPVVLGFPHFYRASSRYQNAVGGLSPHQDKHESFVALEPTTGIPIKGAKRIQINFQVKGTPAMTMTKNAPDTLMPFLWLDEQVELADEQLSMIKDTLLKMLKIFNIVNWVLIAVGSLMVFVGCLMSFLSARRERSHPD